MFAYCANNPASRKDESGEFWNVVIGGVVGGLISGLTTYKQTGSLKKAAIAGAVGALNGAIAATGWHFLVQAGVSLFVSGAGDYIMQRSGEEKKHEDVNAKRVVHNAIWGGSLSLFGSAYGAVFSSLKTIAGKELLHQADTLMYQSFKLSSKELFTQGRQALVQGIRYINTGRGISSVTGSILSWAPGVKFAMS